MEQKRSRSKNFTVADKELLLEAIKPHLKVIECLETNKKDNVEKGNVWDEVTTQFNSQALFPRDAKALKSHYQQFKMKAKKDGAAHNVIIIISSFPISYNHFILF